jgi:hypothetical protein
MEWLEDKFAVVGKRVQMKGDGDRVWTVAEAYRRLPMTKDWVTDARRAHTRWRDATDV